MPTPASTQLDLPAAPFESLLSQAPNGEATEFPSVGVGTGEFVGHHLLGEVDAERGRRAGPSLISNSTRVVLDGQQSGSLAA